MLRIAKLALVYCEWQYPSTWFGCDTRKNGLEVHVFRITGHVQSRFAERAPRMMVAGLGLIVLLVSLLATHSAVNNSNAASVAISSTDSVDSQIPVQDSVTAGSLSLCEENCLEGSGSPLILTVCSVILAVIGFISWAAYSSRAPRLLPRTKDPVEYWPWQLQLFPPLFTTNRLKLSVIRV